MSDVIEQTWLLIKDRPDAQRLYASNNSVGKGYNNNFRKMLVRKFLEVRVFVATFTLPLTMVIHVLYND